MFKKLSLSLVFTVFAFGSYAQTIVSTSPQDKNVVLEEFTGIYCPWCPDGHSRAQAIKDANPDRVSLINIHTGGFANPSGNAPDFRTNYGAAIAGQTGLEGYPSGTVNRHVFSGSNTILDRGQWAGRANQILGTASNVNIAAEANIDVQTNELTVHVEAYYTSSSVESTNKLNVAVLQDNTKGPQSGGGQGNNYNHMHRLVDLITGQWGEDITNTTAGSFIDRTFTYTIPADYRDVPTNLADMKVVVFITETTQEIPTGVTSLPTYTGLTNNNDAAIAEIPEIEPTCDTELSANVVIKNLGADPITSLPITYTINGEAHTFTWTGNLLSLRSETVSLPTVNYTLNSTNTLEVTIPNDDDNSNNSQSTTFDQAAEGTGTVNLEIRTDGYGSECRWNIKDSNGNIIDNGGPYPNNTTVNLTFNLDEDCYLFTGIDTWGDGGTRFTLTDSEGTQLFYAVGNWGAETTGQFGSNGVLGTNDFSTENIALYPNPASTVLNLKNAENANIDVYDILGKLILTQNNIDVDAQINVANLQAGTYFIKISKDNSVTTKKFLVTK
ncbi:T9SS type A sorting domain-containing protein [Aequorivita sinensis]|uniref:T9SS type A sorting domain-containing protein n=1 Tax=Aequorivita sinensis TaxID=1382458 RepID=UPI0011224DE8|nr:Omp28-related outer membrane protein [Aequorivita sinensis]